MNMALSDTETAPWTDEQTKEAARLNGWSDQREEEEQEEEEEEEFEESDLRSFDHYRRTSERTQELLDHALTAVRAGKTDEALLACESATANIELFVANLRHDRKYPGQK